MKKSFSKRLKEITSCILVLLMIILNLAFIPTAKAVGPVLTIGSRTASNGEAISVPITADSFIDVGGMDFTVQFDNTLLSYTGNTPDVLTSPLVNNVGNNIMVNWNDFANPLNLDRETLLTFEFTVISGDSTNTDLSFTSTLELNDSQGEGIDATFNDGVITLNPDETAPTLFEATPVPALTNDNTPDYTFSSSEAGTIIYDGGCTSATTDAEAGNNTITFNTLDDGTYNDCSLTVIDSSENTSVPLTISEFTIDTQAPTLLEVDFVITPTKDNTPSYTFNSDEAGAITYSGGCASDTANSEVGNNTIIFNTLAEGTYDSCGLTVIDLAGNESDLNISTFIIDNTAPVITLTGDAVVNLIVGDDYNEEGATAEDDVDSVIAPVAIGGDTVDNQIIGTYIVTYNISDEAGNAAAEETRTVNVDEAPDETAPILSEITPVLIQTNDNTPDYTFNSDEAGIIAYSGGCASDTTNADAGDNTITFNALADGDYNGCSITVTDNADNESIPLIISDFTIDTIAPVVVITYPADGLITMQSTITVEYTIDGAPYSYIETLSEGENIITINSDVDQAGNIGSESVAVTLDTAIPVITLIGSSTINIYVGDTYADDGATALDNIDGDIATSSIVVTGLPIGTTATGTHIITYNVSDFAGNDAEEVTRTVNINLDTSPPVRDNGLPTGELASGVTQATLSLITDEDAACRYATTTDVVFGIMTGIFGDTGSTTHSTLITGLTDGNSYSYYVKCEDGLGNANDGDYEIIFSIAQTPEPEPASASSGGGGGGGGSYAPPKNTTVTPEPEEEEVILAPEGDVEVLGVESDYRTIQLSNILNEAEIVNSGDVSLILDNIGKARDSESESAGYYKYTAPLIAGFELADDDINAITNFIVYGTETTLALGAGGESRCIKFIQSRVQQTADNAKRVGRRN